MSITMSRFTAEEIRTYKDALVELLRDAVDQGAAVNFLAPLDSSIAAGFWDRVAQAVADGERVLLVAQDDSGMPVGSVQLVLAMQPNGPHRAEVQKVIVHSSQRRKGLGKQLMDEIEREARALQRWLLVLDSERESVAEKYFYESLGYTRAGVLPQFALNSSGTVYCDTVLFYKVLR